MPELRPKHVVFSLLSIITLIIMMLSIITIIIKPISYTMPSLSLFCERKGISHPHNTQAPNAVNCYEMSRKLDKKSTLNSQSKHTLCFPVTATFAALLHITAVVFPMHHFKKYRQMVLILCTTGGSAAYLAMPPLITELLNHFTWRNANLFLAGFCLMASMVGSHISVLVQRYPTVQPQTIPIRLLLLVK